MNLAKNETNLSQNFDYENFRDRLNKTLRFGIKECPRFPPNGFESSDSARKTAESCYFPMSNGVYTAESLKKTFFKSFLLL
jgi:hypothetical protein